MPKKSLRKQMLAQRKALSHAQWTESNRLAQENILSLPEFKRAQCIALYSSINHEVDTSKLLSAAIAAGKRVLYPVVCGREMILRQVDDPEQLQRGFLGILEPCGAGEDYPADKPDLIVIPGVVFDPTGHRIGYGKGYYDRFLQHPGSRAVLVGLCHDFQLIDGKLPADRHDIRMDLIVTEQRVIRCGSNRSRPDDPDSHRGGC